MKESQNQDALLEIGTEEIPAFNLNPALDYMNSFSQDFLQDKKLAYQTLQVYATPRRLSLLLFGVPLKSEDRVEEMIGPSLQVSKDAQNQWTQPAKVFAQSHKTSLDSLQIINTKKGDYLCIRKKHEGTKSEIILTNLFSELISSIPFPKKMAWNQTRFKFARPIRNLVALYGKKILPLKVADVKSTNKTSGLAHYDPKTVTIPSPQSYVTTLKNHCVLVDPEVRKKVILDSASQMASRVKGNLKIDDRLLLEIIWLVEHPVAILGGFDPEFLKLPQEILMVCMKKYQKFFSVLDDKGKLMPYFIAIRNGISQHQETVRKGYEKVLNARLVDAQFFFNEDLKKPLEGYVNKSSTILLQGKLGTLGQKITRMQKIVYSLLEQIGSQVHSPIDRTTVERIVHLSKFDLTTSLVYELPELQGIVGDIYAVHYGEPLTVSNGIREHYLPLTNQSDLPNFPESSLVAVADRLETLSGNFLMGSVPSGNTDPFGLRRHSTGIIRIFLKNKWDISLKECFRNAMDQFNSAELTRSPDQNDLVLKQLLNFMTDRFQLLMGDSNYSLDEIYSVTKNTNDPDVQEFNVTSLRDKIDAIHTIRPHPDFDAIAAASKRASNILKQARDKQIQYSSALFDESLIKEPAEKELHLIIKKVSDENSSLIQQKKYVQALQGCVALRSVLDQFFDKVLVMDPDEAVRLNRLSLLSTFESLFQQLANFSLIQHVPLNKFNESAVPSI